MGQTKKSLAAIEFIDNPTKILDIELAVGSVGTSDHVHIQTKHWRLELLASTFIQFASSVILASSNLRKFKNFENPDHETSDHDT